MTYIYIYIYIYLYILSILHIYIYIYIYIERERERYEEICIYIYIFFYPCLFVYLSIAFVPCLFVYRVIYPSRLTRSICRFSGVGRWPAAGVFNISLSLSLYIYIYIIIYGHHRNKPSVKIQPKEWTTALTFKHLLVSWDLWMYWIGFNSNRGILCC